MPTTKKSTGKRIKETPQPTQLSIWDILEHPQFEKNLAEEMRIFTYAGQHYADLREKIEKQYQADIALLELARQNQLKELLHDYSKPEDFTVKYVEVITKKSKLGHAKRELTEKFFSPIVKRTAIDIINEKEKKCAESSSPEDQSK